MEYSICASVFLIHLPATPLLMFWILALVPSIYRLHAKLQMRIHKKLDKEKIEMQTQVFIGYWMLLLVWYCCFHQQHLEFDFITFAFVVYSFRLPFHSNFFGRVAVNICKLFVHILCLFVVFSIICPLLAV